MLSVSTAIESTLEQCEAPKLKLHQEDTPTLIEIKSNNLSTEHMCIGLGYGPQGLPLDLLTVALAGSEGAKLTVLIADDFQRLNGMSEDEVIIGREKLHGALTLMQRIYGINMSFVLASHIMKTKEYQDVFDGLNYQIGHQGLFGMLLECVPPRFRDNPKSLLYPLEEIACTEFMRRQFGSEVKLGPKTERCYDCVMEALALPVRFAYLCDALPVGVSDPRPVVHYIPGHVGKKGSVRLFLDRPIEGTLSDLQRGSPESLRYLLRMASLAGQRLGNLWCTEAEIKQLGHDALKRVVTRLVAVNILEPLASLRNGVGAHE